MNEVNSSSNGRNTSRVLNLFAALALGIGLMAGVFAGALPAQAQGQAQGQGIKQTSIPAGGTVTLKVRGFCLDFGKPFPTGATTGNNLGDAKVRSALAYAISKGYDSSDAQQVQLAIWYLRDSTWHNESHTIAQEIVTNSANFTIPTGTGTSLADAISQNSVTVSATFTPNSGDAFYGDGTATIKNNTNNALNVWMPIGVVFTAGNNGQFQDLLAYELTAAEQSGTPTAGATAVATGTTSVVTGTATMATTPVTTATTGATSTTAVETSTPAATSTTEVATPQPTATTAMVETPTAEATPTTAPTGATLPATGSGTDGAVTFALLMIAISCALAGAGLLLKFRTRS